MKKMKKFFTSVATVCLLFGISVINVSAADAEYTYKVTFDAGNQGSLSGTAGLSITGAGYKVSEENGKIIVSGLKANDVVSFDAQAGAVTMKDDNKYYVKGVRRSGRDNNEVAVPSFPVTGDADYVVAYGIKGNMVGYTVNYQDEAGNELAPSRTYYGNVGEKPVVAHIYVEGYTPQALALTKTLSENEAENVFTFVYQEGETQIVTTPGETITTTVTETADGATTGTAGGTDAGTTGTDAGTTGPGTDAGTTGPGADGGTTEPGTEEGEPQGPGADDTTEIQEDEVPQGQQDVVDLDEEETPLGNLEIDKEDVKKGMPLAAGIAIAVVAVAGLAGLLIFVKKHR